MKRKPLDEALCPIARSLDQVGDWWSLLIVRDLLAGKRRFSDLHDSLGIARNMLSARLKRLVACGVVAPQPASDGSARQEYALTEKGRDLVTVLVALGQWGRRWTSCDAEAKEGGGAAPGPPRRGVAPSTPTKGVSPFGDPNR